MRLKWIFAAVAFTGIFTAACNQNEKQTMDKKDVKPIIDTSNFDKSVKPGNDFYTYVNGGWLKKHPLPADKSRYGAFDEIAERNKKRIREILENAMNANAPKGSSEQKIGDFYYSGMDTDAINKAGLKPVQPFFDEVDKLQDKKDVASLLAMFSKKGGHNLFYIYADQDATNSENVIAKIWQGGLTLPDRDYYTSDDPRSQEIRKDYKEHLVKMHQLMGLPEEEAKKAADIIMNVETKLAETSNTRLENRDPQARLNHKNRKELAEMMPHFDWDTYFKEIGYPAIDMVNVDQPKYLKGLDKVLADVSLDDWKTYFKWHIVDGAAPYLGKEIEEQNFDFFGRKLSGKKVQEPRWKRVLASTQGALGMAVGQEFVKKYFPPEAKQRMLELIGNLKKSLEQRINQLAWMSDSTKKNAIEKLHAIAVKVGYPEKWRDYSGLQVSRDSYFDNVLRANEFEFAYTMNKIGKPVDRTEWGMTPQTVNAYYNPSMNEIVFPAGILQSPFFDMNADDAVNYGAIGVVIGHEMTHGFDDQGRQFDAKGNLRNWWTEEDTKKFKEYTHKLVEQYNEFEPFEGYHVNGELTLGENIADFGGLTVAYNAYLMSLEGKPEPKPIDGLTDKQRFFIAYAQVWRNQISDEELKRRLKEDVHSPGKYRVNGALFNVPEFYQAFPEIQPGDKLYRTKEQRAVIW